MIFENKTAWFSDSCPDNVKKLWVDNGGKLEDVALSQYVFSDDWQHDDTKILYHSEAYLKQHLAIFSSQYIPDAIHQGVDNVSLGKYFLIPGPIKDSITLRNLQATNSVALNNNIAGPSSKQLIAGQSSKQLIAGPSSKQAQQIPSSDNEHNNKRRKDGNSSSETSASSSAGMCSAVADQLLQQHVSNDTVNPATSQLKSQNLADTEAVSVLNSHPLLKSRCTEIRQIDLESIPHVQSLPKVISCLQTIHPGRDGVQVKNKT